MGGQGGGQWFPAYTTSSIGVAIGGTAGLAQFGIVGFVD